MIAVPTRIHIKVHTVWVQTPTSIHVAVTPDPVLLDVPSHIGVTHQLEVPKRISIRVYE